MERLASTINNPLALVAFIVAAVLSVVFLRSKQEAPFRWFALVLAGIAILGGLVITSRGTGGNSAAPVPSMSTGGNDSPIVTGTKGDVFIKSDRASSPQ